MTRIVSVGLGELAVSDSAEDTIKTYGLGSCIAVVVYDRRRQRGGLLHVVYPESSSNKQRAEQQPAYFADTGVPLLMKQFTRQGSIDRRDLVIRIAGGANMMDSEGRFNIGKRNALAVKKALWNLGLGASAEDVGGSIGRTVWIEIATGSLTVANGSRRWKL